MAKSKKTKYVIVSSSDYNFLTREVERYLAEGYELAGGVSTAISVRDQYSIVYSQAVTL